MVTETQVDEAAVHTIGILNDLLGSVDPLAGEGWKSRTVKGAAAVGVRRALCVDASVDFLTDPDGNVIGYYAKPEKFRVQLALCDACTLKTACLEWALETRSEFGIWGGTLPAERT